VRRVTHVVIALFLRTICVPRAATVLALRSTGGRTTMFGPYISLHGPHLDQSEAPTGRPPFRSIFTGHSISEVRLRTHLRPPSCGRLIR
jgi:hypothetical protein